MVLLHVAFFSPLRSVFAKGSDTAFAAPAALWDPVGLATRLRQRFPWRV